MEVLEIRRDEDMKVIGLVLAGVLVGYVIKEIVSKKNPDAFNSVGQKATDMISSFKSAFRDGYSQAAAETA